MLFRSVSYQPRTSIKSQALADFIADFTPAELTQAEKELFCLQEKSNLPWKLSVDGSSNFKGVGLGIVLTSPEGDIIQRAIRCGFKATNNESEYEALIAGLSLARDMGITKLQVQSDSQLVVNQLQGSYQTRDTKMAAYLKIVKELQVGFESFSILQVPRVENSHADSLANLGAAIQTTTPMSIPLVYVQWPATWKDEPLDQTIAEISSEPSWMTPIISYLLSGQLPEDKNEARRIKAKAARFTLYNNQLYKRSYSGPLLRCVSPIEVKYILTELHEGECGNHSGARSLANRALTTGYYWPTMRADSKEFVQKCDPCQRHSNVSHLPAEKLHSTIAPWPFMKWGMDIVGKLPTAPGQRVFMLAVTDYFTKWVEAEAYKQVRDRDVKNFIWRHVICRFGVPKEIVTDNGSQFISREFQDFCEEWGIKLTFSTPRYPQANGQAEATNKTIMNSLKKRLTQAKGAWADELPAVLWSYRTTPDRKSTRLNSSHAQ